MTKEKTLAILKPDIIGRNLIGDAISYIDNIFCKTNSIVINKLELRLLNEKTVEEFYVEHKERFFFPDMVKRMCSKPVILIVLEGENVVKLFREFIGSTNPSMAAINTFRNKFAVSIDENSVHGSDSVLNAAREIKLFFNEKVNGK